MLLFSKVLTFPIKFIINILSMYLVFIFISLIRISEKITRGLRAILPP